MKTFLLVCLLTAALLPRRAAADTYPRQPGVDAIHYVFRLTLSDDTNEITGDATVEIKFLQDGLKEFTLDLATPTPNGSGMTVSEVTVSNAPVQFTHETNLLHLTLDPPVRPANIAGSPSVITASPPAAWSSAKTSLASAPFSA